MLVWSSLVCVVCVRRVIINVLSLFFNLFSDNCVHSIEITGQQKSFQHDLLTLINTGGSREEIVQTGLAYEHYLKDQVMGFICRKEVNATELPGNLPEDLCAIAKEIAESLRFFAEHKDALGLDTTTCWFFEESLTETFFRFLEPQLVWDNSGEGEPFQTPIGTTDVEDIEDVEDVVDDDSSISLDSIDPDSKPHAKDDECFVIDDQEMEEIEQETRRALDEVHAFGSVGLPPDTVSQFRKTFIAGQLGKRLKLVHNHWQQLRSELED